MENTELMQKFEKAQEEYTYTYLSFGYFYSYSISSKIGPVSYEKLLADEKVLRDGHLYQVNEEAKKSGKENISSPSYISFTLYQNELVTAINDLVKPTLVEINYQSLDYTNVHIWSDVDEDYVKAIFQVEFDGQKYMFKYVGRSDKPEKIVCEQVK